MSNRDLLLDEMKGIGCILMVFAHSLMFPVVDSKILFYTQYIGGFAPIFFFAIVGVTASFQARRKKTIHLLIYYCFFFLLGLSFNGMMQIDFVNNFQFEILNIIALGTIIVYLIEKNIKPGNITYLYISLITFFIHFYISQTTALQNIPLRQIIFPPGYFTIFPWISYFFIGIFIYNIKNTKNYILIILATIFSISIIYFINVDLNILDKWNMSIGYFMLSLLILFSSFYIFRSNIFHKTNEILVYYGKNSLLFLYLHFLVIFLVSLSITYSGITKYIDFNVITNFIMYIILLTIIYLILRIHDRFYTIFRKFFETYKIWVFMIIVILIVPIIFGNSLNTYFIETFMGIIFATYYRVLSGLMEKPIL